MVGQFLKYLSFEKRYSVHTVGAYKKDLGQFTSFLSLEYEIDDVMTVTHVIARGWVVDLMERGIAPKSVNRKIAALKSFYKFLQGREYMETNPAKSLKPLKVDKGLPSFLKEEEMSNLLDHVSFGSGFSGQRDRLILELFYHTGMRLAELYQLRETDVNVYEKTIKVLGKRNKERIIPVSNSLIQSINLYINLKNKEGMKNGYLLVTNKGKQVYPMFVQRKVRDYLSAVTTLEKKSPHVIRHSFATHLLNKGADLNAVKDLLGHSGLAATQVYTHNSIEKLKAAFDQAHPKA